MLGQKEAVSAQRMTYVCSVPRQCSSQSEHRAGHQACRDKITRHGQRVNDKRMLRDACPLGNRDG